MGERVAALIGFSVVVYFAGDLGSDWWTVLTLPVMALLLITLLFGVPETKAERDADNEWVGYALMLITLANIAAITYTLNYAFNFFSPELPDPSAKARLGNTEYFMVHTISADEVLNEIKHQYAEHLESVSFNFAALAAALVTGVAVLGASLSSRGVWGWAPVTVLLVFGFSSYRIFVLPEEEPDFDVLVERVVSGVPDRYMPTKLAHCDGLHGWLKRDAEVTSKERITKLDLLTGDVEVERDWSYSPKIEEPLSLSAAEFVNDQPGALCDRENSTREGLWGNACDSYAYCVSVLAVNLRGGAPADFEEIPRDKAIEFARKLRD